MADHLNHRIQKFTSEDEFVTKWGSEGSGDGQFDWPSGIAVAGSYAYLTDGDHGFMILRVPVTAGNVTIHPAQSYSTSTHVLSLSALVADTLYGAVVSGTFSWSLRNSSDAEVANGSIDYDGAIRDGS